MRLGMTMYREMSQGRQGAGPPSASSGPHFRDNASSSNSAARDEEEDVPYTQAVKAFVSQAGSSSVDETLAKDTALIPDELAEALVLDANALREGKQPGARLAQIKDGNRQMEAARMMRDQRQQRERAAAVHRAQKIQPSHYSAIPPPPPKRAKIEAAEMAALDAKRKEIEAKRTAAIQRRQASFTSQSPSAVSLGNHSGSRDSRPPPRLPDAPNRQYNVINGVRIPWGTPMFTSGEDGPPRRIQYLDHQC